MISQLTSFDGTETYASDYVSPENFQQLSAAVSGDVSAIPRGGGLSYCAASAGPGIRSISSLKFNRILGFDGSKGLIDVESGMRLGDLYQFTVPRGWILPIMPGHPSISVGGCIGCNVHGKNQYREGNFINTIDRITIFHPDHGEIRCSLNQEPILFRMTVGGFGLTGFITSVRLKLKRLSGGSVRLRRFPVADLTETVEVMEKYAQDAEMLYSWNNFNLRGRSFGRGIVYVGSLGPASICGKSIFCDMSVDKRSRFPLNMYTKWTTRLMLGAYEWSQRLSEEEELIGLAQASFPPHGKELYFQLFGRKGFREYQLLVPRLRWDEASELFRQIVQRWNVPITLGSLKLFKGQTDFLHFNGTGVVLTIDIPESEEGYKLFRDLDMMTLSCGGLVNLSKDGRIGASFAERIFPGCDRFRTELAVFDPHRRFDSSLRRRLCL